MAAPAAAAGNNTVKRGKIRSPELFEGDHADTVRFIYDCDLFLNYHATGYPTDQDKIMFVLSHMKTGTAGAWGQNFVKTHTDNAGALTLGTYANFKDELKKAFSPALTEETAKIKLDSMLQGSKDFDEFRAEFMRLMNESGINEEKTKIHLFLKNLQPRIAQQIMMIDPLPDNLAAVMEKAANINSGFQRARALYGGRPSRVRYFEGFGGSTTGSQPKIKQEEGLGIRKLTQAERERYQKEGRCFNCGETGHMVRECKKRRPGNRPNRPNTPKWREIRTMIAELDEESKEDLKDELLATGF